MLYSISPLATPAMTSRPSRAAGASAASDSKETTPNDRVQISLPAVEPKPLPAVSMDFDLDQFRVKPGESVDLTRISTAPPEGVSSVTPMVRS